MHLEQNANSQFLHDFSLQNIENDFLQSEHDIMTYLLFDELFTQYLKFPLI